LDEDSGRAKEEGNKINQENVRSCDGEIYEKDGELCIIKEGNVEYSANILGNLEQ